MELVDIREMRPIRAIDNIIFTFTFTFAQISISHRHSRTIGNLQSK